MDTEHFIVPSSDYVVYIRLQRYDIFGVGTQLINVIQAWGNGKSL